jgi:hypothetical protein
MVYGEQSANQLRDRFQPTLTHAFIGDHINKLIDSSLGSHWTRLYDSVRSTSSWADLLILMWGSINIILSRYCDD